MNDWFFKQGGRDRLINWLGLDAWLDSSIAAAWERVKDGYDAMSSFFARFKLTGWRRLINEGVSEALTMGAGGLVVLYGLALPAFNEVEDGRWLSTGKYSVKFLDVNGNEIGRRGINLNDAVPLDEIPETLIKATLATEDRRFYEHFGVDFIGTARALFTNLNAGENVQGGSTLTQQLAKNLFLSSERSIQRKLKEVFLAFWLESRLTKREILKLYLDRAYLGGGAFGVEAASQFYFGKSVRDINLAESAMLSGLYKAPTKYAPHVNLPASRARTNDVLSNLVEAGFYTSGQVQTARLNPARIVESRTASSPDWFLDWAYEEIQRVMDGKNQYIVTARTTIDLNRQRQAEDALINVIRQAGRSANVSSGALVSMEPDGAVRAIVGGMDYGESQFNRATHALRQPGSSFKIYVYAAAMEAGLITSRSTVRDGTGPCGNWYPQNYSGGGGSGRSLSVGDAFKTSLNTTAVDLSLKVGREKVMELTERLGVKGVKRTCSMALGDTGIAPIQHTGAYATFANGGKLAKPYGILEVYNNKGEIVYSHARDEPEAPQVVPRRVAEQMNQIMQLVVTEGTGKKGALDFTWAVGKTGTSSSYRDAWFMGFTGALVTGVWLGNDDYRPMNRITGGSLPAEVWHNYMAVAHTSMDIPLIAGLSPHPVQVAEQQRLAELRRRDPAAAAAATAGRAGLMPTETKEVLRKLATAMRRANQVPGAPDAPPGPGQPQPPALAPERRADNGTSAQGLFGGRAEPMRP